MVAVQNHATVNTDVRPYTEVLVLTFLVTGAADLTGLLWVDFIDGDTGAFCLVLNQFYEGSPSSI